MVEINNRAKCSGNIRKKEERELSLQASHYVSLWLIISRAEAKQEKIVEAGGFTSLLMPLRGSEDEMIRRVAVGAIANLAMNESNQELIMGEGGIGLLSMTAADAEDPQTLRMVAGAIANLCGNGKFKSCSR
ncbi:hypothetical protein Syun_006932 [Stephania yunnanensis]|uniref:Vacuolar protein 8 n=1 Tax=Stephania yunnanensis TaxID=152371 RepID=A0AAP0KXT7_9MAGN